MRKLYHVQADVACRQVGIRIVVYDLEASLRTERADKDVDRFPDGQSTSISSHSLQIAFPRDLAFEAAEPGARPRGPSDPGTLAKISDVPFFWLLSWSCTRRTLER